MQDKPVKPAALEVQLVQQPLWIDFVCSFSCLYEDRLGLVFDLVDAQHIFLEVREQTLMVRLEHSFHKKGGQATHDDEGLDVLLVIEHRAGFLKVFEPLESVLVPLAKIRLTAAAKSCRVPCQEVAKIAKPELLPILETVDELFAVASLLAGVGIDVVCAWVLFLEVKALHEAFVEGERDVVT